MRKIFILNTLVLIASLTLFLRGGGMVRDKLKFVIDGDTAQFQSMRCRFAYVDTPESGNNQKSYRDSNLLGIPLDQMYVAGRYAKRYTKSRLKKGKYYSIDVVKPSGKYGRAICEIFLEDGRSLNSLLVADGFAVPFWRYIPRSKRQEFRALSLSAKDKKRGLWRLNPSVINAMLK